MYQIGDVYNQDLTKKVGATTNIHALHQHRDQITGVERMKSFARKKKKDMIGRINLNMRNRQVAELAQNFLKTNNPVKCGENTTND